MGCLKRIELSYPLPQSGALTTKLQAPKNSWPHSCNDVPSNDNCDTTKLSWKHRYCPDFCLCGELLIFFYHCFYTLHKQRGLEYAARHPCRSLSHPSSLNAYDQCKSSFSREFGKTCCRSTYRSLILIDPSGFYRLSCYTHDR